MARRYDAQTTTFSPEGRLYQVEYAMAATGSAPSAIAIQTKEGIVIAVEKKITSKLLAPPKSSEKLSIIDSHVLAAVAGQTADANILINYARLAAQRYKYTYQEPQPVEQLVQILCDQKHYFTQYGGLRPYGVAFLYAGWDKHYGYQLYQSDPSGTYSGWKATAIGSNNSSATSSLKNEYREDLKLKEAIHLATKTLTKAMDTTAPSSEKVEIATLYRDEVTNEVVQRFFTAKEVDAVLKEIANSTATSGDV